MFSTICDAHAAASVSETKLRGEKGSVTLLLDPLFLISEPLRGKVLGWNGEGFDREVPCAW